MKVLRPAILGFLTGFYIVTETAHFGYHLYPKSDAEWIADGIGLVLIGISLMSLGN